MRNQRFDQRLSILLGGLTLFTLLAFLVFGLGIYWWADDLSDAVRVTERGVIGAVVDLYQNWSGRYTANFLAGVSKLMPTALPTYVILALWLIGIGLVVHKLRLKPVYAMLVMVVTLAGLSNPVEVFYWQSGLMAYGLWIACATWLLALHLYKAPWWAGVILAFIMAGISETGTVALVTILFLCSRKYPHVRITLIGALAGAIVLYIAPGNSVRTAEFIRPGLLQAGLLGLQGTGLPLLSLFLFAPLLTLTLVMWFLVVLVRSRRIDRRAALFGCLLTLAVCFTTMVTGYYATGTPLVLRALAIPQYVILAGMILFIASRIRYTLIPAWIEPVTITVLVLLALVRVTELRVL